MKYMHEKRVGLQIKLLGAVFNYFFEWITIKLIHRSDYFRSNG